MEKWETSTDSYLHEKLAAKSYYLTQWSRINPRMNHPVASLSIEMRERHQKIRQVWAYCETFMPSAPEMDIQLRSSNTTKQLFTLLSLCKAAELQPLKREDCTKLKPVVTARQRCWKKGQKRVPFIGTNHQKHPEKSNLKDIVVTQIVKQLKKHTCLEMIRNGQIWEEDSHYPSNERASETFHQWNQMGKIF